MKQPIIGDMQKNKELQFSWGRVTWMEDRQTTPHGKQAFGVVHIQPGCSNPLHYHDNCEEANYIIEGRAECRVADKVYYREDGAISAFLQVLPTP